MTKPDHVYCCLLWSSDESNDCSTGNLNFKSLNDSTSSGRFSSFVCMPAVFSVRAIGQLHKRGDFTSLQSAESLASQTIFQHVPGNLARSLTALSHGLLASSQNKFKPALCFPHMRRYQYHVRCTLMLVNNKDESHGPNHIYLLSRDTSQLRMKVHGWSLLISF